MPEIFVHEFVSPINRYKAIAVKHGLNVYPVALFEGRQCYATASNRVWGGKGRNYHSRLTVYFLDNGECRSIPAGLWGRKAKNPPLPADTQ
jgi:hypothetical protein